MRLPSSLLTDVLVITLGLLSSVSCLGADSHVEEKHAYAYINCAVSLRNVNDIDKITRTSSNPSQAIHSIIDESISKCRPYKDVFLEDMVASGIDHQDANGRLAKIDEQIGNIIILAFQRRAAEKQDRTGQPQ